jgi:hypothetical protein
VGRDYRSGPHAQLTVGAELLRPCNTFLWWRDNNTWGDVTNPGSAPVPPAPGHSWLVRDRYHADCNDSAGMERRAPTGHAVSDFVNSYVSSIYSRDDRSVPPERALRYAGRRASMAQARRRECRHGTIPSGMFRRPRTRFPFREGRKGSQHSMGVTARRRHVPARGRWNAAHSIPQWLRPGGQDA